MASTGNRSRKHFQLDALKIKRAQRALHAKTETEAIERALDLAIAENRRNRLALKANERFLQSGIDIQDVYGTLER
jgi:Arc/MetJ family transcription regulator